MQVSLSLSQVTDPVTALAPGEGREEEPHLLFSLFHSPPSSRGGLDSLQKKKSKKRRTEEEGEKGVVVRSLVRWRNWREQLEIRP